MKRFRTTLEVLVLATAVSFLWLQQREITDLRERLVAASKADEAALEKIPAWSESAKAPSEQALAGLAELPRLRGEVSALRRELAEKSKTTEQLKRLAKIDAAKEEKQSGPTAFGNEARDFGAATPERAATSLIWAATSGRTDRLSELLELPASVSESDALSHYDFFANMLSNKFSRLEFTEITSVKPNPDGTLRLGIMYRDPETGRTNPFPFMMRQHETGWKVVVEGDVPKRM